MIFNRDGRKIHVWKSSEGLMISGHFPTHYRVSDDDNGTGWDLWDPPGGPCIIVGMELSDLHEDFKGLLADKIIPTDDENVVIVKCRSVK